jgi:uncharacterized protein (TIGR03086 family)
MQTGQGMSGSVAHGAPMTNDTSTAPTSATIDGSDPRDVIASTMATAVEVIAAVRPEQMELPTPCPDYDVRGLIAHLVAVLDRIEMFGTQGDVGSVGVQSELLADDEWVSRWDATVHRVLDAWADDSRLDAEMRLPWRTMTGRPALAIYTNELTVHTWDLAHATGQHPAWDPEVLAVSSHAIHTELPGSERAAQWQEVAAQLPPGVPFTAPFADAVDVPADAAPVERLVAWNGRRP